MHLLSEGFRDTRRASGSIRRLFCDYNRLSKLDLNSFTNLVDVCCTYNELTNLIVTGNQLVNLHCEHNHLRGILDLSLCPSLLYVDARHNMLTAIKISSNHPPLNLFPDPGVTVCFDFKGILRFVTKEEVARRECRDSLQQIQLAKEQWSIVEHKKTGDTLVVSKVDEYIKNGHPKCLEGGEYVYGVVGEVPKCTIHGAWDGEQKSTP